MRYSHAFFGLAAIAAITIPSIAQMPTNVPGTKDRSRVAAGTYKTDPSHSQIAWEVTHFGFNPYHGLFGDVTGTLTIDPKNLAAASVNVTIPIISVASSSDGLNKHLLGPDFFDVTKFTTATFKSTHITVDKDGDEAKITGDLTIKGVTRSVTLDADFTGAGTNPFNKKQTIGFEADTTIRRSEFGLSYGIPMVTDLVKLQISVAFEKQ